MFLHMKQPCLIKFWQYNFPLNEDSLNKLTNELSVIPPFLIQAEKPFWKCKGSMDGRKEILKRN